MLCRGILSLFLLGWVVALNDQPDVTESLPSGIIILEDDVTEPPPSDAIILEDMAGNDEMSEGLFEGDIMLTEEQRRELLSRKAVTGTWGQWPRSADQGIDIFFRYADSTIDRAGVQAGIDLWQESTCIRFHEIPSNRAVSHLVFTHHDTECSSYIGRVYSRAGQTINLTPACVTKVGHVLHEIGHAIALFHEQMRSDRDNYITINMANVVPRYRGNFGKRNTNNFGLPYDYSSMLHYAGDYFTVNGKNTIETKNVFAQPLIGQRDHLSFMDIKIINLKYQCTVKWLGECSMATDPCQNHGYTNSSCLCACPPGTSGDYCETLIMTYTDALITASSFNENVTTETIIASPLFPAPVTTDLAYVQLITAPECYTVKITFTTFDFHPTTPESDMGVRCEVMGLEIRTDDTPNSGTIYCGTDIIEGQSFTSTGRTMVLFFRSEGNSGSHTGYNVSVEFVRETSDDCATTTPLPTTLTPPTTGNTIPPACTVINSGALPLKASLSGSCTLSHVLNSVFNLTSPNYPAPYGIGDRCIGWFSTDEPRYVRVTPVSVDINRRDFIDFWHVYRKRTRVTNALEGGELIFPASSARMRFISRVSGPSTEFAFNMEVVNSDCHQIIDIPAGETCTLSIPPNYPAGTICEWWIRAPVGRRVRVEFTRFDIGSPRCREDHLVIDVTGNTRYTGARRYCGDQRRSPRTVLSRSNQVNILLNGMVGGFDGFEAIYTAL